MNTNQPANNAASNIFLKNEKEIMLASRILNERKSNSSIVSAGLSLGVHPKVIEAYLPELLEATKKYNEQSKTK
jgi:hypothetical protein